MGQRHFMFVVKDGKYVELYSQWGAYYTDQVLRMVDILTDNIGDIKKLTDIEKLLDLNKEVTSDEDKEPARNCFLLNSKGMLKDIKNDDIMSKLLKNEFFGNSDNYSVSILDLNKKTYNFPFLNSNFLKIKKLQESQYGKVFSRKRLTKFKKDLKNKGFISDFKVDLNLLDNKQIAIEIFNMVNNDDLILDFESLNEDKKKEKYILQSFFHKNSKEITNYIEFLITSDKDDEKEQGCIFIEALKDFNVNDYYLNTEIEITISEKDNNLLNKIKLMDTLKETLKEKKLKI